MHDYEVFHRQPGRWRRTGPAVTFSPRGVIIFNIDAYEHLGSPEAVHILVSKKDRLVSFRSAAVSEPDACKITRPNLSFSAASLYGYLGIDRSVARRYPLICDDGPPHIDVSGPGTPVTSNRRKKPAA